MYMILKVSAAPPPSNRSGRCKGAVTVVVLIWIKNVQNLTHSNVTEIEAR